MKMVDLTCPGCGAQMKYNATERLASCEYCGRMLLVIEDEKESSKALSRMENAELSEEELAERRRKNLLKAQAMSDGYKGLNWQEDRSDFERISQRAWRRGVVDRNDSFWDPSSDETDWSWLKPCVGMICLVCFLVLKLLVR